MGAFDQCECYLCIKYQQASTSRMKHCSHKPLIKHVIAFYYIFIKYSQMLLIFQIWVKGHKSAYNYKYTNVKYIPACTLVSLAFLAAKWLYINLCRYLSFVLVYEIITARIFKFLNIKDGLC